MRRQWLTKRKFSRALPKRNRMSEDSHTFEVAHGVVYPLPKVEGPRPYVGPAGAKLLEGVSLRLEDILSYLEWTEDRMLKRFSSEIIYRRTILRELMRLAKRDVTKGKEEQLWV